LGAKACLTLTAGGPCSWLSGCGWMLTAKAVLLARPD
jgi:hypothetical protein